MWNSSEYQYFTSPTCRRHVPTTGEDSAAGSRSSMSHAGGCKSASSAGGPIWGEGLRPGTPSPAASAYPVTAKSASWRTPPSGKMLLWILLNRRPGGRRLMHWVSKGRDAINRVRITFAMWSEAAHPRAMRVDVNRPPRPEALYGGGVEAGHTFACGFGVPGYG